MKRHFTSGLALLLPLALTLVIVNLAINLVTRPFLEVAENLLGSWHFFHHWPLFDSFALLMFSKLFVLFSLALFVMMLGLLADYFFIGALLKIANDLLHRLPFFNKIYKLFQDIVQTFFSPTSASFSQVVLAPFPTDKSWVFGFVVKTPKSNEASSSSSLSVFIPGALNATVGYLLTFQQEQLIFLDVSVEEAMKFVLSCGMTPPPIPLKDRPTAPSS